MTIIRNKKKKKVLQHAYIRRYSKMIVLLCQLIQAFMHHCFVIGVVPIVKLKTYQVYRGHSITTPVQRRCQSENRTTSFSAPRGHSRHSGAFFNTVLSIYLSSPDFFGLVVRFDACNKCHAEVPDSGHNNNGRPSATPSSAEAAIISSLANIRQRFMLTESFFVLSVICF